MKCDFCWLDYSVLLMQLNNRPICPHCWMDYVKYEVGKGREAASVRSEPL